MCLKAVKGLNYPVYHEKSHAKRLAKVNKKLLEMEKIAQMDSFRADTDQEEQTPGEKKKEEKLDLLNLYVKEMREPIYQEVPKDKKGKPGENFNRIYLPNGQQVALKTF